MNYIVVRLTDSIHAYNAERKVSIKEKVIGGEIENNLTVDAQNAGISQNATYQLGQIFDYTIDFFRLRHIGNQILFQRPINWQTTNRYVALLWFD